MLHVQGGWNEDKTSLNYSKVHPPFPSINVDQKKKKTVKLLLNIAVYCISC